MRVPAQAVLPDAGRQAPARRRRRRHACRRVQAARGQRASRTTPTSAAARGRRPSRPRRRARSRSPRPRGCGACSTRRRGARRIPRQAAGLLHGVRLPDQPAGPASSACAWRSSPPTSTSPTGWPTATRGCASVAQYKLIDEAALASFQTGLRFIDGRAKPAYDAYRLPIWVSGRGSRLRVYGQVRPGAGLDAAGRADPGAAAARRRVPDRPDGHRALAQRPVPRARAERGRACGAWPGARLVSREARSRRDDRAGGAPRSRWRSPVAAPAHAASNLEVGMEDERLLLSEPVAAPRARSPRGRPRASTSCASTRAGSTSRPAATRSAGPRGFDLADHRSRRYDWATLDRAVDLTSARRDAGDAERDRARAAVDLARAAAAQPALQAVAAAVRAFARAVATRYRDRVDRYLIWNEPNVAGLARAAADVRARRVCFPASPHIYRGLVRAARPAIERADPGAQVLLGELAPRGHRRDLDPLARVAAAVPARAGVRRPALQADADRAVPRLPARAAPTPSATTRTASSSGPRTRTPTATRRRSATSRGCSRCSTG